MTFCLKKNERKIIDRKGLALHLALKQTPYWVRGGLGGNETLNQSEHCEEKGRFSLLLLAPLSKEAAPRSRSHDPLYSAMKMIALIHLNIMLL